MSLFTEKYQRKLTAIPSKFHSADPRLRASQFFKQEEFYVTEWGSVIRILGGTWPEKSWKH